MQTVGEIGIALGVLLPAEADQAASGFARAFPVRPADDAKLGGCKVEIAQVHHASDPDRAAILAGREVRDTRKAVLVGAGAIGSHLAEYLAREGRFEWAVVDDDRLLPHNLARHTLRSPQVGLLKARALKDQLNSIFTPAGPVVVTKTVGCDVLNPGAHAGKLAAVLAAADIVIDASASVAASRHLADLSIGARRASAFFNPSAEAAVVILEAGDRSVGLRDLEAQYYRAVLQSDELERHLTAVGERFAYTGACRAVTSRVPASRAALLSSLAAQGLGRALDGPEPFIGIWTLGPEGQVTFIRAAVAPVEGERLIDWEIAVDAGIRGAMCEMRRLTLPSETGGALIGVVDALAHKIHLVEALTPPPDSIGSPSRFERGIAGPTSWASTAG